MSGRVRFSRSGSPLTSRRMVAEPVAAEVLLRQAAALQEHAPRPVEDDDAFAEERCEVVDPVHALQPSGGRNGMTNGQVE